jgi:hypothetical protein
VNFSQLEKTAENHKPQKEKEQHYEDRSKNKGKEGYLCGIRHFHINL